MRRPVPGADLAICAAIFILLVALPLVPLLLSAAEHFTLGTDHVEDFFRQAGLHEPLSRLYNGIGRLFKR